MAAIPKYARSAPRQKVVQIICRGQCGRTRYAEVSRYPWTPDGSSWNRELYATCLMCGYKAHDNYNWIAV